MATYLKLIGAATYNSRSTGKLQKGDTCRIDDDELAELLLEKGEKMVDGDGDTFLKPLFSEVSPRLNETSAQLAQKTPVATQQQLDDLEAANAELARRLAAATAPQAPVGLGVNQAESTTEVPDVDTEDDGSQNSAYHEPGEGVQEELEEQPAPTEEVEEAEEEAKPATATAKVTRQRTTTGTKK